jgi:hypothetical protein
MSSLLRFLLSALQQSSVGRPRKKLRAKGRCLRAALTLRLALHADAPEHGVPKLPNLLVTLLDGGVDGIAERKQVLPLQEQDLGLHQATAIQRNAITNGSSADAASGSNAAGRIEACTMQHAQDMLAALNVSNVSYCHLATKLGTSCAVARDLRPS